MQIIQLSIPEPCHESWQAMTPTEQGRFCNACAKEVVDFSMMTDTEVLNYFSLPKYEKVCGRALPTQLERTIAMPKEPVKRRFWYWNYITMLFLFFGKESAKAQSRRTAVGGNMQVITKEELNKVTQVNVNTALGGRVGGITVRQINRTISGKITNDEGQLIPFASIKIKNLNQGISTDSSGKFTISVKDTNTALEISAMGYESKEFKVSDIKSEQVITLQRKIQKMGEVVITSYPMMGAIRHCTTGTMVVTQKETKTIADTVKTIISRFINTAKIYPNPVEAGQSFTLSIQLKQSGNYSLTVNDAAGKMLLQKPFTAAAKQVTETIVTDNKWSSGIYYISVFNEKNNLMSTNSFIVQ